MTSNEAKKLVEQLNEDNQHDLLMYLAEKFDYRIVQVQGRDTIVDKTYYLNKITAKFYVDIQNFYNFENQEQDIIVREEDGNGNFLTTGNGTQYVLKEVENTSGNILPTIGIILEF